MSIDAIAPSNIKVGSSFYNAIQSVCSDAAVKKVIEIGGGIGDGATRAIISALRAKPTVKQKFVSIELSTRKFELLQSSFAGIGFASALNASTSAAASYPLRSDLKDFYWAQVTDFRKTELDQWIELCELEKDYITARGAQLITSGFSEAFSITDGCDFVLINGSDFTGFDAYDEAQDETPKYIALCDTFNIKCYQADQTLSGGGAYTKIASGTDPLYQWSIFKKNP